MSRQIILYLALGQALVIAVMVLYLLVQRRTEAERKRTEEARLGELREAMRRWIRGELEDTEARRRLEEAPFPLVRSLLEETVGDGAGAEGEARSAEAERIVELVRSSTWWDRVERWSRSPRFWWRRLRAAVLLRLAGRAEDAPLIRPLLSDERPVVASAALLVARDLTPDALLEPLLEQAAETEPGQARLLREALLAYGNRLLPELRRRLEEPRSAGELEFLLRLAAGLPEPALRDRVEELARDERMEIRVEAVRTLRSFGEAAEAGGPPSRLGVFLEASRDPEWPVRVQAARGLGAVGGSGAVDRLGELLRDPAWWVRLRAAAALSELGEEGRDELVEGRQSEDRFARDMAGYVLRLGSPGGGAPSPAGGAT